MAKYTNARYPDKVNDLIDNDGNLNAAAVANKADLVGGKVPADELPSYVDDVVECNSFSDFPAEGEEGKIYIAKDTGFTYRWGGTQYVQIGGQDLSEFATKDYVGEAIAAAIGDALDASY